MISLIATRLSEDGRFRYSVMKNGQPLITTDDVTAAAKELSRLGVENPDPLIAHARNWGAVEIVERKRYEPEE